MEECQCSGPGYCEFFKQEMTYDPPTITSMTDVPTRGGDLYISGTSFGPLGYVVRALFSVPTAQAARR